MTTSTPTSGGQPDKSQTRARHFLTPQEIIHEDAFQFRQTGIDKGHVHYLAQTLRNVGDLDPVLVWEETDEAGQPPGYFRLLDGHHRLAAYAKIKGRTAPVPVKVIRGDRAAALVEALQANTRESLPLTRSERTDAAWRLVRFPSKRLPVSTIAKAAGVGSSTVDRMRKRWAAMQAAGKTAGGSWWHDQRDELPEMKDRPEMTDKERKAATEALAQRLKGAFDKMPWQDQELAADALRLAVGPYKLRSMTAWLFGEDEFAEEPESAAYGPPEVPATDTAGEAF